VYAHRDAIESIRRALRNAQNDDQKRDALELLGETSHFIGQYPDALSAFTDALDIVEARQDRHRAITLRRKLIKLERDHGGTTLDAVESQLVHLAAEARVLDASRELCEILWILNMLPTAQHAAVERANEATALSEREGDRHQIARALYNLGRALATGPDPRAAVPRIEAALKIWQDLDDRFRIGDCRNMLGILHILTGEHRPASEQFRAAAESFNTVGAPYHEAGVRNNLGVLLTRLGEWDAAEENLREAIRLNLRLDMIANLLSPLENLADLFQTAGRWTEADEQWHVLLEQARVAGYWNAEVIARCGIGGVAIEQGDLDAARTQELIAREILVTHESWSEARAAYHFLSAKIAAAAGEQDGAIHFLRTAEDELVSRDRYVWATFRLFRAQITYAIDPREAEPLARDALSAFEQIGSEPMRQRALSLIATTAGAS
jgi:tetratricopeptide (TPR) repeat protein